MAEFKTALRAAMQLHASGQAQQAFEAYNTLAKTFPNRPEPFNCLGKLAIQTGNAKQAIPYFEKAFKLEPRNVDHLAPLMEIYRIADNPDAEIIVCQRILDVIPTQPNAGQRLHDLAIVSRQFHQAVPYFEKLVSLYPKNLRFVATLIDLLERAGRYTESAKYYDMMLQLDDKNDPKLLPWYIQMLIRTGQFDSAREEINTALEKEPEHEELNLVSASLYSAFGQHAKVVEGLDKVLKLQPDDAKIKYKKLLYRFMLDGIHGDMNDFNLRFDADMAIKFEFDFPHWKGEPLKGKHILLWSEQGIGDVIMFASMIPWLLEQEAELTIASYPKMIDILQRAFPEAHMLQLAAGKIRLPATASFDYHSSFGGLVEFVLPHYTPYEHPGFLKAEPSLTQKYRTKYQTMRGDSETPYLVGISWNTINAENCYIRNIPLKKWEEIFAIPGVQFVSLQYNTDMDEVKAFRNGDDYKLIIDNDFEAYHNPDNSAAQIAAMDEVISIQNATVHTGGALGVPTTIMLSSACDWRWGNEGIYPIENLWYNSVTIARQETPMKWEPVISRVAEQLRQNVSKHIAA